MLSREHYSFSSNTCLLKAIELAFFLRWRKSYLDEGEESPNMAYFPGIKSWCLNVSGYWPVACRKSLCHWNSSTPFEEYSEYVTQTSWSLCFRDPCLRVRILAYITSSGAYARLCARVTVHGNSLLTVDQSRWFWQNWLLGEISSNRLSINW